MASGNPGAVHIAEFRRLSAISAFSFDEIDGKFSLAAPQFEACAPSDTDAVIDAVTKLLNSVNAALRLSGAECNGLELCSIVERRNSKTDPVVLPRSMVFSVRPAVAVALAGHLGEPARSREERLVSLMGRDERVDDIANTLSSRPMTWGGLAKAYETVVGIMSSKSNPGEARADYQNLVAKGWFTDGESERFYRTAAYHRHGYPKLPNRTSNPMTYQDACALIQRLFWRLVDELEPT